MPVTMGDYTQAIIIQPTCTELQTSQDSGHMNVMTEGQESNQTMGPTVGQPQEGTKDITHMAAVTSQDNTWKVAEIPPEGRVEEVLQCFSIKDLEYILKK